MLVGAGAAEATEVLYFNRRVGQGYISTVTLPSLKGDPAPRVFAGPMAAKGGPEAAKALAAAIALRSLQADPQLGPTLSGVTIEAKKAKPRRKRSKPKWRPWQKEKASEGEARPARKAIPNIDAKRWLQQVVVAIAQSDAVRCRYEVSEAGGQFTSTVVLPPVPGESTNRSYIGKGGANAEAANINAARAALGMLRVEEPFSNMELLKVPSVMPLKLQPLSEELHAAIMKVLPQKWTRRGDNVRKSYVSPAALQIAAAKLSGTADSNVTFEYRATIGLACFPEKEPVTFTGDFKSTVVESKQSAAAAALAVIKEDPAFTEPPKGAVMDNARDFGILLAWLRARYVGEGVDATYRLLADAVSEVRVTFKDSSGTERRLTGEELLLEAAKAV